MLESSPWVEQMLECAWRKKGTREVYDTVGIAEDPTITVENVKTGEREHYVIGSPLFQDRFVKLEPVDQASAGSARPSLGD